MDVTTQVALSRQTALERELSMIANNLANMSTIGYRQEQGVFSEFVNATPSGDSVSMSAMRTRFQSDTPGGHRMTGAPLDIAVDGEGYFQVERGGEPRLTRAGSFMTNAEGEVVTPLGARLLDAAGVPVVLPPDAADIAIGADGTMTAGGVPIAQLGLFESAPGASFEREDGVHFRSDQPFQPVLEGRMVQGALEQSNVVPVAEMTRMIEVQRAYEFSQSLQEREDDRIRSVIRTLGEPPR
ncbi:flagellar hook-basal body complex protein [Pontivivens ytuae]|uniref:Flagellar hook-basal body complex protein n=1 Tax=Pontivivens ytuae TaxID=2789856 RepID=A0A7S9QBD7_9RHOB|nr:flagellar hook-basal body complex protein [Pontivivens ytuae]QPH53088.1 flagellar hook-basal body complex protein [Pontivivens ytuae]